MVRKANKNDIKRIIELLHQVNIVHHVIRPDLFKPHTTKYDEILIDAAHLPHHQWWGWPTQDVE